MRKTQTGFWAFFPAEVPRRVPLSDEVVKLLDEANGAVHRLGGVGRLVPNPHLLIGPHLRLEAVLSSRIEGTKTDVGQLLLFEVGQVPSRDAADDATEVNNYIVAMEHGLDRVRGGFPVSVRLLREMHERLLQGVRGQHRRPGELRSSPVWIGGSSLEDAVFVPPPPDEMKPALSDLERFLHERDLPLLIQLAIAHYQFAVIHPFLDGNGRIGRLLIPLMLVLRDALPQPLLYLSAYFEQHRSEYYDHLLITSQKGDLMPWLEFLPPGRAATGARLRRADRQARRAPAPAPQRAPRRRTAELGHPTGRAAVLRACRDGRARRGNHRRDPPTAHAAIDALVERGDLVEITGRERHRIYEAPRIFEAVYGPIDGPDQV